MRQRRPDTDEEAAEARRAFADVQEVLRGTLLLGLNGHVSKVLRFLIGLQDTEATITPERFVIHFRQHKKQHPTRYFPRLAPAVMSEILSRARAAKISGPSLLELPADTVPEAGHPSWSYSARLIWIVPREDVVRVVVRSSPVSVREPRVAAIPTAGPKALPPELPKWVPEPPAFIELPQPVPCAHCGARTSRYRRLREAIVCQTCGSSRTRSP